MSSNPPNLYIDHQSIWRACKTVACSYGMFCPRSNFGRSWIEVWCFVRKGTKFRVNRSWTEVRSRILIEIRSNFGQCVCRTELLPKSDQSRDKLWWHRNILEILPKSDQSSIKFGTFLLTPYVRTDDALERIACLSQTPLTEKCQLCHWTRKFYKMLSGQINPLRQIHLPKPMSGALGKYR